MPPKESNDDDKCGKCSKVVYAMEALYAEGSVFHKNCFKCGKCKKQLASFGYFLTPNGGIFCKNHKPSIMITKSGTIISTTSKELINSTEKNLGVSGSQELFASPTNDVRYKTVKSEDQLHENEKPHSLSRNKSLGSIEVNGSSNRSNPIPGKISIETSSSTESSPRALAASPIGISKILSPASNFADHPPINISALVKQWETPSSATSTKSFSRKDPNDDVNSPKISEISSNFQKKNVKLELKRKVGSITSHDSVESTFASSTLSKELEKELSNASSPKSMKPDEIKETEKINSPIVIQSDTEKIPEYHSETPIVTLPSILATTTNENLQITAETQLDQVKVKKMPEEVNQKSSSETFKNNPKQVKIEVQSTTNADGYKVLSDSADENKNSTFGSTVIEPTLGHRSTMSISLNTYELTGSQSQCTPSIAKIDPNDPFMNGDSEKRPIEILKSDERTSRQSKLMTSNEDLSNGRKKNDHLVLDITRKRANTVNVLKAPNRTKPSPSFLSPNGMQSSAMGHFNQSNKNDGERRTASKEERSDSNEFLFSKAMEEEKRTEYVVRQYQKVKQSSVQVKKCCEKLQNIVQESRIGLLQEFVSQFRTARDSLRKFIDLTAVAVANLDLRRNGVDMLKFEILMTTEFLLGNGLSPNAEEFKTLMDQMNINIDTVMKKYQPESKMMVKNVPGFKEESCFDNPYFLASEVSYENMTLEHVFDNLYYRNTFVGNDHQTFIGMVEKWNAVIISIMKDETTEEAKIHELYKVIVRFRDLPENHTTLSALQVKKSFLGKKPSIKQILQLLDKDINFSKLKQKETDRLVETRLLSLDEFRYRPTYKFGLLLCKPGQTTDDQYFSNCEGPPEYETFLDIIATRTKLKGFQGFAGGLDVAHGKTGVDFLYTKWKNFEVAFHCSTLLPYNSDDQQQIERKRHIGNDVINVVFLGGDMQFDPTSIKTQFTHVFILIKSEMVQNENDISVPGYRVAITSSVDVPKFGPPLPNPPVFTDFITLQHFLLAKLINAENAALKAPKFAKPNDRARHALFDSIVEEFSAKNSDLPGKSGASGLTRMFSLQKKHKEIRSMNDLSKISGNLSTAGLGTMPKTGNKLGTVNEKLSESAPILKSTSKSNNFLL